MKLQTQAWISAVLPVAFAVMIGLLLVYAARQVDEIRGRVETVNAIARGIFDVNILTREYAQHATARVVAQWRVRHDSLSRLLADADWSQNEEMGLLANLRRDHAEKGRLFAELDTTPPGPWRERIIGQMRAKAQAMDSVARQLEEQHHRELIAFQQRVDTLVLGAVITLAVAMGLIQLLLSRRVVHCIDGLVQGIKTFAAGNLMYHIPPGGIAELDVVATHFNDMARHLVESTTSVENLVRESAERKRAEEAMRDLAAIVDSSDDAILRMTPNGEIASANLAARQLYGYDELPGRSVIDLVPPDLQDEERQIFRRVVSGDHVKHYQTVRLRRDGSQVPVSLTVSPIRDAEGRVVAISKIARDITELKQVEGEIRRLNAELEQRVLARTAELTAANKELEAFAYSVSHDLRAPLRAVDGFARILNEEYADQLDAEGQRQIVVIRDSAKKMGQLIDDLLAFSRMGRREMAFADIDMTVLARDVAEELRKLETARTIEIAVAPLPPTHGDPAMMRQVWTNLFSNAIKFTRPRTPARIEVGGRAEERENIYWVKDNGVGFNMQYVDKLFGVFQRLHGPEEFEGTGVGLALAQRIIHRHGGRIWAEGKVDEGATFFFILPNRAS